MNVALFSCLGLQWVVDREVVVVGELGSVVARVGHLSWH